MPVVWELDFYSRPVVDDNKKKLWEVLICESPTGVTSDLDSLYRYEQFCPNTQVNSGWLRQALEEAIAQAPQRPDKVRFFRRQMANMITKACQDAGVPIYASRRTLALNQWLQQRMENYYPTLPNYQAGANPSVMMPAPNPKPLPDALIGQQWAIVTLEASAFQEMPDWQIDFGEGFPIALAALTSETPIPGLLVFSPRALPLAAWMSGLELAYLKLEESTPPRLLLETGAGDSWVLATLPTPELEAEGKRFEAAKQAANQVHFIAVQSDPNADSFTGFWMLQELNLA